jgi:Membrane protein involved in the export of O-antigen and teichoic acid
MRELTKSKQLAVNMISALVSYGLSLMISFFLSPYIINRVGVEANGYITLANNFVTYASLLTIALNSMASRFVTIKLEQGKLEEANIYYNSVLGANIFMSAFLAILSIPCLFFLEKLIAIPDNLVSDVKLLFLFIFINFLVSIFSSTFAIATFATNRLYLSNLRTAESQAIRVGALLLLFAVCATRVSLVGIATLLASFFVMVSNLIFRKQLLPQIKIKKAYFKLKSVWEIMISGIWNTITRLGQILLSGLDILIANIFISPTAMGILSLSMLIPQAVSGLVGTMAGVFTPDLTIDYAKGNIEGVVQNAKRSMKMMATIVNIPIIVIIINGDQFFRLWTPSQNANQLQLLSVLAMSCLIVSGGINVIYNIFTVVNRLKLNALTVVLNGILSTAIVFILLKTTDLGLIAIVATSELIGLVRVLAFVVPYGAKCLNQKWYTFYPEALVPLIPAAISIGIGYVLKKVVPVHSWMTYFAFSLILAVIALLCNGWIILNRRERTTLKRMIVAKLGKRNS